MKRWCAGGGAFGAAQAVHLWTMRFAHRPACRGQRIRVAHRAGLRPQAPQPPTTINEPVSQLWSYRGDKYSDAGGVTGTETDAGTYDAIGRRVYIGWRMSI